MGALGITASNGLSPSTPRRGREIGTEVSSRKTKTRMHERVNACTKVEEISKVAAKSTACGRERLT